MKTHKKLIRKTSLPLLLLAGSLTLLLPSCAEEQYSDQEQVAMNEVDALPTREELMIEELQAALDEIQRNIALVHETEKRLQTVENYPEGAEDKREQIVRDIQMMNTLLAMDRQTITSLEKKLKSAGVNNAKLNKQIAELNGVVAQQEARVAELIATLEDRDINIASLHTSLDSLSLQMAMRESMIANLNDSITETLNEANKVYLAQDSRQHLIENGVITKEGAILGIGGQATIAASPDNDQFIELDKRKVTTIPVYAKRVEMITPHPSESYKIVETPDKKVASIEIRDPEEFWKTSPYLVLAVK